MYRQGQQGCSSGRNPTQALGGLPPMDLLADNARLRAQRDDARRQVVERDSQLRALRAELESYQTKARNLVDTIEQHKDLVEKQKRTIKVQSDKIKAPAETNISRHADQSASTSFPAPSQPQSVGGGILLPARPNTTRPAGPLPQPQPMLPPPLPASAYGRRDSQASAQDDHSVMQWLSSTPSSRRGNEKAMVPWRGPNTPSPPKRGSNQPNASSRRGSVQHSSSVWTQPPPSLRGQSSSDLNTLIPHITPRQGSYQPDLNIWGQPPPHLPPPRQISNNSNTLMAQTNASASVTSWHTVFTALFTMSEAWAHSFCNTPTDTAALSSSLMQTFKDHSSPATALGLLSSSKTRYFLIAALINHWLTNDVLRFHIIRGFSASYDAKFREHRDSMESSSNNVSLYRAHAQIQAEDVQHMCNEPGFATHSHSLSITRTDLLWSHLRPLLAPATLHAHAYTELSHIFQESFRIGFLMASEPLHFDFEYPTVMPATWFESREMVNRDPEMREDSATVMKRGRKVRMAFSPCVKVSNLVEGVRGRVVTQAGVLLMA